MPNIDFERITSKDALAGYSMTCILVILLYASSQGTDGVLLATGIGILGGLGGFYRGKKVSEP